MEPAWHKFGRKLQKKGKKTGENPNLEKEGLL